MTASYAVDDLCDGDPSLKFRHSVKEGLWISVFLALLAFNIDDIVPF